MPILWGASEAALEQAYATAGQIAAKLNREWTNDSRGYDPQ